MLARAAIRAVPWMMGPVYPRPERVYGREQNAQANAFAHRKQIVPELDHWRDEAASGLLKVAMPDLRIFEHQPKAGDAVGSEMFEVLLDRVQIAAAEQSRKLRPTNCIIVPKWCPRRTAPIDKVA